MTPPISPPVAVPMTPPLAAPITPPVTVPITPPVATPTTVPVSVPAAPVPPSGVINLPGVLRVGAIDLVLRYGS